MINKRFIFISGVDRSGTTMLASMLKVPNQVHVLPEAPFKFRFLKSNWNDIPSESAYEKYYSSHGFKEIPTQKEWLNYIESFKEEYLVDHTPKNQNFLLELKNSYSNSCFINITRNFDTLFISHYSLSWGTKIASVLFLRKLINVVKVRFVFIIFALSGKKCLSLKFEDLLRFNHDSLRNFCEDIGLKIPRKMVSSNIGIPEFSRNQHSLVGKSFDLSKTKANYSGLPIAKKIIVYLLSKLGIIFLPIALIFEFGEIAKKIWTKFLKKSEKI